MKDVNESVLWGSVVCLLRLFAAPAHQPLSEHFAVLPLVDYSNQMPDPLPNYLSDWLLCALRRVPWHTFA